MGYIGINPSIRTLFPPFSMASGGLGRLSLASCGQDLRRLLLQLPELIVTSAAF